MRSGAIEINGEQLDEIVPNICLKMDSAIQIIANDKRVRSETAHDLKDFSNQSLATHAKKGKQLVSMLPAIKKDLNLLGYDTVELSTETDALESKIGSYDEKLLEESEAKLLKQIDDGKKSKIN